MGFACVSRLALLWDLFLAGLTHPSSLVLRVWVFSSHGQALAGQDSHSQEVHGRPWGWGSPRRGPGARCPKPGALLLSPGGRVLPLKPRAHGWIVRVSFLFVFCFSKTPNVSTSFLTSGHVLCLSQRAAGLDLGAPHASKSPSGGGDKEGSLGGGTRAFESNTQNKPGDSRTSWQKGHGPSPLRGLNQLLPNAPVSSRQPASWLPRGRSHDLP